MWYATDKQLAIDRAVARGAPRLERFAGHPWQVVAEPVTLSFAATGKRLKVPLQVSPAPSNAAQLPPHLDPGAGHASAKRAAQ